MAEQDGQLNVITGSLLDGQRASCWAIVTRDGRYDYVVNAGSSNISEYSVSPDGTLTLVNPTGATTGTGSVRTDPALSTDSVFFYVRDGALGVVDAFRVEADGSLTPVGTTAGNPTGGQGLAAR